MTIFQFAMSATSGQNLPIRSMAPTLDAALRAAQGGVDHHHIRLHGSNQRGIEEAQGLQDSKILQELCKLCTI